MECRCSVPCPESHFFISFRQLDFMEELRINVHSFIIDFFVSDVLINERPTGLTITKSNAPGKRHKLSSSQACLYEVQLYSNYVTPLLPC